MMIRPFVSVWLPWLTIFCLGVVFPIEQVLAWSLCEESFVLTSLSTKPTETHSVSPIISPRLVNRWSLGQNYVLLTEEYSYGDLAVSVYHPQRRWSDLDRRLFLESSEEHPGGIELFRSVIQESVALFLGQARQRREWPESFLNQLPEIAARYALWSTYIVVRKKYAFGEQETIGVIRYISAPYAFVRKRDTGRVAIFDPDMNPFDFLFPGNRPQLKNSQLPMETILGVQLPRFPSPSPFDFQSPNGGQFEIGLSSLTEPGNFTIKKGSGDYKTALALIAAESYLYLFRLNSLAPYVVPYMASPSDSIFTYGGKDSQRMYRSIGFQTRGEMHGSLVPEFSVLGVNVASFENSFFDSPLNRHLDARLIDGLKVHAEQLMFESLSPFPTWNLEVDFHYPSTLDQFEIEFPPTSQWDN